MPTGYTAKLIEKGQTFPEFALTCARAFGACVELRDESLDTPLPDAFVPSPYHANALKKARATLTRLERMTKAERVAYGVKQQKHLLASYRRGAASQQKQNAVLAAMEQTVASWHPPTPDHYDIKAFMLQQIDVSKSKSDFYENATKEIAAITPFQYWADEVADAKRSITRHINEMKKEKERAERNTRWIQALRNSLK